jgi:2-amino-4-hydroxy-6-hydroxymethyldihydropteridine diphosphokinase / dihydropteroate synthase
MTASDGKKAHRAFIALGSNMGDCIVNIEEACLHMERSGIKIKRTSSLFETAPMYVLEQQPFINGACEVCLTSRKLFSPVSCD